jgi:hypothetical protein
VCTLVLVLFFAALLIFFFEERGLWEDIQERKKGNMEDHGKKKRILKQEYKKPRENLARHRHENGGVRSPHFRRGVFLFAAVLANQSSCTARKISSRKTRPVTFTPCAAAYVCIALSGQFGSGSSVAGSVGITNRTRAATSSDSPGNVASAAVAAGIMATDGGIL